MSIQTINNLKTYLDALTPDLKALLNYVPLKHDIVIYHSATTRTSYNWPPPLYSEGTVSKLLLTDSMLLLGVAGFSPVPKSCLPLTHRW